VTRRLLWLAWIGLVVDTIFFAPSALPSPLDLGWRLTAFQWGEPSLVALWYATGIVLFLHATCLLAEEPLSFPHPLWMLVLSPIFGSLVTLPYYALRRPDPRRAAWRWPFAALRAVLIAELIGFALYGAIAGDLRALWHEVGARRFSHFLLADFALLSAQLALLASGALTPGPDVARWYDGERTT